MARILFVTGTDTGVGKTVVTCLLTRHLRAQGEDAVAVKPLCAGGLEDVRALGLVQDHALSREQICPFHFRKPLTPLIAARAEGKVVTLARAVACVRRIDHACILVEGAGGLLSPLGPGWFAADWIKALRAEVILVAADRLGTLNHTLLTVEALRRRGCSRVRVVLNAVGPVADASVRFNIGLLRERLKRMVVGKVPWLGTDPVGGKGVGVEEKKVKKTLAGLARSYSFSSAL